MIIKRLLVGLLASLAAAACLTINIYFPAEEVKGAADKIVQEVWGEEKGVRTSDEEGAARQDSLLQSILLQSAHAEQDINVSTPQIRAIKASIKARAEKLKGLMDSGRAGLGQDGFLKAHDTSALNLKQVAELNQLIAAENSDRRKLYKEIAKANGFPGRVDEVQRIFARSWIEQAQAGWFIEQGGRWSKK